MSEDRPRRDQAAVEVVVPVRNAERALPGRVAELERFLEEWFPYRWRITIADTASTDRTRRVAEELAAGKDVVGVRHLPRKGRGLALRTVLTESDADVVVFVDNGRGLEGLVPLVVPLVLGQSDVAVDARPGRAARLPRVRRGVRAVRTAAVRPVLDRVRDDGWLFDTELLLVAERTGLRVHEVPLDEGAQAETATAERSRRFQVVAVCVAAVVAAAVLVPVVLRKRFPRGECIPSF